MTTIVSFTEFLRTGRLGPLHTGMTPGEVALLLGIPSGWIVDDGDPFPLYWCYGRLEIAFQVGHRASDRPSMRFFQIEHADGLAGDGEAFPGATKTELVMTLDGLDGRAKPSDILRALGEVGDTHVRFEFVRDDEDLTVSVTHADVTMIWTSQFLATNPRGVAGIEACARAAEANGRLDSIYAFAPAPPAAQAAEAGAIEPEPPAPVARPPARSVVQDTSSVPDPARRLAIVCAAETYLAVLDREA